MNNYLYYWQILPYRYLERAYRAGKHIRKVKRDYFLYRNMLLSSKRSWRSIIFYMNTELNNSVFTIYLSLLQYRISLSLTNLFHLFGFIGPNRLFGENIPTHKYYDSEISAACSGGSRRKTNRKLIWIEATLNDLRIWKRYYLFLPFPSIGEKGENKYYSLETELFGLAAIAYESIGLLPRSITRTFYRFKAELMNQSSSLVPQEFRLAKYQALASLQYVGCLIFIPLAISTPSRKCFLEPLINRWWNNYPSQIFLTSFQEEKALEKLQEIEELFWLDRIVTNSDMQLQDSNDLIHQQTVELVEIYNDDSVETISHLLTDIIYFITLSGLFIPGKERLVILNSWTQELFHSLSDTMKAFSILLLTDSCIGFHSPHGWEIIISSCSEHFGFVHNERVISCFVSTFPVILDTVFKYLIFRHSNRISPSIVATYHTMNE
nr:chloroplast envelope membrane protein [Pellia epiphylla]WIA68262.1 chloroplast envelope membrane protein [Pellia epiphylla]WIA68348.1 chloroplast envelope membrane protein [Pellia epiphylla]